MTHENFHESIGPQQPEPDTKKPEPDTEKFVYRARPNRDLAVTAIPGILWRAQERRKKEAPTQEGETKPSAPTEAGEQSLDARVLELYALAQEYALEPATMSAARHTERVEALASVSGTNKDEYLAKLQNIFENESSASAVSQSDKIPVDQETELEDAELKQLAGERRARLKSAMLDLLADDHLRTRYEAEVSSEKSLMRVPETRKRLQEIFTTRALRNRFSAERRILLVKEFLAKEQLPGGGKRSKTAGRTPEAIRNLERGTVLAEEKENTITARLSAPERGFLATENLLQRKRELDAKGFVLSPSRERLLSQIADLTAKGFRVFLGGPTGTGKTSIALFALKEMTGGNFSWVTWTGDTSVRDLFGSPKLTTTKEGKLESGMTKGPVTRGVIGEKSGVLHEELTAGQTGVQMSMKTLWAAKPGEQINLPGFNGTEFTKEQLIELATGNLKDQRHAEREAMDPAVAREFKAIEVPFMSARETRDYLILPELIDRSGVMPLSRKEVGMVDQFCKAAELSQLAYLEEIPEEVKENDLYKIISPTGDDITLTGVFLDTGTVKDLFSGWRASGKPLSVHLSEGLRRFVDENPHFREAKTERETIKNILRAYGFNLDTTEQIAFFTPTGGSIKPEQQYQKPSELGYLIPTPPLSSEDEFMPQGGEEAEKPETVKGVSILETKLEGPVAEQIEAAIEKLGKENVFGPNEVEKTFGVHLAEVPGIPFSVEELERAEKMGQMLVLRVDKTAEGKPMSLEAMNDILVGTEENPGKWKKEKKGSLLGTPVGWESLIKEGYKKDVPRSGWALVSREVLPESLGKNYIEQTDVIIKTLKDKVFKGMEIPEKYAKAIAEFESQKERLTKLVDDDWYDVREQLSALEITQMTRQTIQETIYDLAMYYDTNNKRLLTDKFTRSASVSPDGGLVNLGGFDGGGVTGRGWGPDDRDGGLGVSFSRRL